MENSLNRVKVFSDPQNYRRSFIISLAIVFIPMLFGLLLGFINTLYLFFEAVIFMLSFVILIIINGRLYANNSSFIYDEGRVFKITHFPGEAGKTANAARAAGSLMGNDAAGALVGGAILLNSNGKREDQQNQLVFDSEYRNKLYTTEYSMQLLKVRSMKKYHNGYKIKSNCRWNYGGKIRDGRHNFYIFPGFNNYDQLVECLQNLMD